MSVPSNWQEILANNIKIEMKRLGWDQQKLATELGFDSRATISIWITAKGLPRLDTLIKLCLLFDRTPNGLMIEDLGNSPPPIKRYDRETIDVELGGQQPAAAQPEQEKPPKREKEDRLNEIERKFIDIAIELRELRGN